MIFAELQYDQSYAEVHEPLVALLVRHFPDVRAGLQGDSWVWIVEAGQKVAVDTFTSMQHQVKSPGPSFLVDEVLTVLARQYQLRILHPPGLEAHEPEDA